MRTRLGWTILGGAVGFAFAHTMKASAAGNRFRALRSDYRSHDFEVPEILREVPLHDAWSLRLHGAEGRKVRHLLEIFSSLDPDSLSPVVRALFGLRRLVGQILVLDPPDPSADRESEDASGESRMRSIGPFRFVYESDSEALAEARNATVHAYAHWAIVPSLEGYTGYWAIYVKEVNRWTPVYMSLVDPFRKAYVYPEIISRVEREWARRYLYS